MSIEILITLYIIVAIGIPVGLYFGFGKKAGLEWGFAEFLLIFPLLPFLSYFLLIWATVTDSK